MRIVALISPAFHARIPASVVVHDVDGLRRALPGADALVLAPRYGDMIRDVWSEARHLRWIHTLGAGVEKLPFDLLRETDIIITNSRGVYADALGEFVIAALLWFAKDFRHLVDNQAARKWEALEVERLEGATLGIIGYGSIGQAVGRRAEGLGMRVAGARRGGGASIDEVIRAADYIVLSTPLTPATRHLMNAARIASMKPTAVLINIARGAIVEEAALIDALAAKRIRGAALDVFEIEPLPADNPLWSLPNVLISPHSADRTRDSHERAVAFFEQNLRRFERGEPLENIVDKNAGY